MLNGIVITALAAFKRHIRHREADIIADLLDGLEEAKSQLNEQREYYEERYL